MKNSMGNIISTRRKELSLTQQELADMLGVTDKAVSKWERDISRPDVDTLPKLAEVLDISLNQLMSVSTRTANQNADFDSIVTTVLKAVGLACGVAVLTLSALKQLEIPTAITLLAIGQLCTALVMFKNK